MKIILDGYADSNILSAQDHNARDLGVELVKIHHEVYLFVKDQTFLSDSIKESKIKFLHVGKGRLIPNLKILFIKMSLKADILITGKVNLGSFLFVIFRKFKLNSIIQIHLIENLRPSYYSSFIYDYCAKQITKKSDYTYGISTRIIDTSFNWCGKNIPKIFAIGVDPKIFYPQALPKEYDVVCCSSMSKRKRPLFFLELAKKNPKYKFAWIGDGELRDKMYREIEKNNIVNLRIFTQLDHFNIARIFNKSKVFFLPSLHEGFPKVLLEAIACGIPCIAFSNYGPEIIDDNYNGFVINHDNECLEKIEILLNNSELYKEFSIRSIKKAENYTWDKIALNFNLLFEKIFIGREYADSING